MFALGARDSGFESQYPDQLKKDPEGLFLIGRGKKEHFCSFAWDSKRASMSERSEDSSVGAAAS